MRFLRHTALALLGGDVGDGGGGGWCGSMDGNLKKEEILCLSQWNWRLSLTLLFPTN
jgi:hypothetical protein